ncbi:MAG: cellulase family glycosylhydrolase [Treponema sp.]|nr:cellulase family glycosylhydrolase [Treponema sp.]
MKKFDGFMHGVNLGGWYSQCDHSENRYDTFITEDDFKTISSWGMDHIRLPVDYNLVESADGKPIEKGYERLQKAINWCKKYNLNMILDLHKTAGFSFDKGEKEAGFFDNPVYQERFYKLWESFANHFANAFEGTDREICFELLNEVTDQSFCKKWNAIARTCIERIRKIAPETKILVGSYWNNSLASVKDLDEPYDENIVYNFHCYDPLLFTHQGAPWVGDLMNPDFRFALKSKFSEYEKMTEAKVGQIGITFKMFPQDATVDEKYFESIFAEAVNIAESRNVRLYCGEYGVIDRASPEDTLEWYRLISTSFNRHGIGRAAWSYKQMDFGLSDSRLDGIRSELSKYL